MEHLSLGRGRLGPRLGFCRVCHLQYEIHTKFVLQVTNRCPSTIQQLPTIIQREGSVTWKKLRTSDGWTALSFCALLRISSKSCSSSAAVEVDDCCSSSSSCGSFAGASPFFWSPGSFFVQPVNKSMYMRECVYIYKSFILLARIRWSGEKTTNNNKNRNFVQKKKKKKKNQISHAGNRTPATAVRAPDPNH